MDVLSNLALGFGVALTLKNLTYCFLGVFLGTLIGVLPGIGPLVTIAMLLPITFGLDPVSSLIMLAGIFYGAQYGGSTTAILVNMPGEVSSAVTAIDGYQMARQGRAGPALATAAIASFVAGIISTLLVAFFGPLVGKWALEFGAAEYFSLMLMGLVFSAVLAQARPTMKLQHRRELPDIDAHQLAVRRYASLEARLKAAQALAGWADDDTVNHPGAAEMADPFAADFALEALHAVERHGVDFGLTQDDLAAAFPAGMRAALAHQLDEGRFRGLAEVRCRPRLRQPRCHPWRGCRSDPGAARCGGVCGPAGGADRPAHSSGRPVRAGRADRRHGRARLLWHVHPGRIRRHRHE